MFTVNFQKHTLIVVTFLCIKQRKIKTYIIFYVLLSFIVLSSLFLSNNLLINLIIQVVLMLILNSRRIQIFYQCWSVALYCGLSNYSYFNRINIFSISILQYHQQSNTILLEVRLYRVVCIIIDIS